MSFDELPPGLPLPSDEEGSEANSQRETSASDAPPAKTPRRRRARTAGSDAASTPETPEPSARAPRRRRATAEETTNASLPEPPAAEAASEPAKPRPRRASRTKTETAATAEVTPAPEPPADTTPVEPATKPTRRPRRKPETPAVVAEAVAEVAPVEEVSPETEAPKRPVRRDSRRRKAEPVVPEAVALPETSAETLPEVPTTGETPDAEPGSRRRRSSRTRRRPEKPETTEESVAAEPATILEPPVTDSTEEEEDAESGRSGRPRRRRGGRSRRTREETPAAVEAAPVPVVIEYAEPTLEFVGPIDLAIGAHLIPRYGMPEIRINATFHAPLLFFGNMESDENRERVMSETRHAARAGVHLHSTLLELPCPLRPAALETFTARVKALLEADPDGFVMPRLAFYPLKSWIRENPSEIALYTDGSRVDPSVTSENFWQEAELSLEALIAYVQEQEWGGRIFGYHLERGEWFQPVDSGYDRSPANRDAFRNWLRVKYEDNIVRLRAAWYDGNAQFQTVEIPAQIATPNPIRAFHETRRERRYIDFYEFTSESTAQRLITLARTVKKATGGKALVSVCYGYTFEFGHPFSGHLALASLLDSPYIDLICGPPSYRDRSAGGAASFPTPVDSMPLHGKLFLSEDDTRTWLAPVSLDPDDFNPRFGDREATQQAQFRTMGKVLAHGTALGWMDLWGEGWLNEEALWENMGSFASRYATALQQTEGRRIPQVVALIDEKSLLHIQRGEPFFRRMTNGLNDLLERAGISYGTYLQSDLLSDDFPTEAKLYLFLTPYRLTADQRAVIAEKLQRDGKTLFWLYAPGACEQRPTQGGMMEETATGAIGMTLVQQEWNSEIGSRVIVQNHALTSKLPNRELGTRERFNPSYYVDDPEATTLAEYQGSGLPSLALRDFGTWRSIFFGEPTLPLELLRGICRYAGVHVWTPQGEDVVSAGNGWMMLHATKDGQRTLYLPEPMGLYDVTERRLVADETKEYRVFLKAGTTKLFCVGPTERFVALGLPNVSVSGSARNRIILDLPPVPVSRREPATRPVPRNSDLETLEAVLNMSIEDIEEIDAPLDIEEAIANSLNMAQNIEPEEAEETEESIASARRRRRRGGRGRGRRRTGSISEAKTESPSDESSGGEPE